jgi:ABC-type multidrug transport system permease subunit
MWNIFELIIKNFKLLFRNKSSTLIFILGPLFVVLMLGFAFNTADIYGLKLASYSAEYNDLSNSLLSKLSSQFAIIKTPTQQNCIDGVKLNDWHVCLIFPSDFSITKNNNIDFYVNPTKMNLVYIITNMISATVSEEKTEISRELVEALILKLQAINKEADKSKSITKSIRTSINSVKDTTANLKNQFSDLDFSFEEDDFPIQLIDSNITGIKEQTKIISQSLSNVSGDGTSMIITAYRKINSYAALLEDATLNLSKAVNKTRDQLNAAAAVKDDVNKDFNEAITKLNDILIEITSLEESISGIKQEAEFGIDAGLIVKPITTSVKKVTTERRYISFIFPVLVVLLLMFGGIFLGSSLVISEKTSRAYFRNLIIPVRKITFVAASYITTMIILILEVAIIFGILYIFTRVAVSPGLLLEIFIIGSVFVFLGLLIGYFSRTAEISMLISIAIVALLLFFSNLILPIEAIGYLREVAVYNPFTIAASIVKENMLLGLGMKFQTRYLTILFGYLAIAFTASLLAQQISKKHV